MQMQKPVAPLNLLNFFAFIVKTRLTYETNVPVHTGKAFCETITARLHLRTTRPDSQGGKWN